jgi:hypothetical protein
MLTKCPSCDRQIPADSHRCPYCGKKLDPPPFLDDQPPKKRESLLLACWEMLQGKRPVSCAGIAIATSFFVFALACVLCVLVWGFAPKNSAKPALRLPRIVASTPRPTSMALPTVEPTITPSPLAPPYEEISENMQAMTVVQWNRYREDIEGTQVISWTGWVEDVTEKAFSSCELQIDMDPPESRFGTFDVRFDIPTGEEALAIAKDSPITFSGRIGLISDLSQATLVISLEDAQWTIESNGSTPTPLENKDEPDDLTPPPAPSSSPEAPIIIETEDGVITVPGSAYMDGRDLEANPPVTVMNINVWDSPQRSEVACQIEHGTPVDVLELEENEAEHRGYLKVKSSDCEGWVPISFVNPKEHEPEGEQL